MKAGSSGAVSALLSAAPRASLVPTRSIRPRAVVAAALGVMALLLAAPPGSSAADQPWRDASQPPLQRANELLAALDSDQKVSLALGDFTPVAQLGVPALTSDDGPNGVRADGTTALPSAQALAASFDRSLARAYGDVVASELRAKGYNMWLGPAMDITRTPLSGRQPENLGEDPFLAGQTAAQEVLGAKAEHVISTLKHYVANNQEWDRVGVQDTTDPNHRGPSVNALVSERALQEIYQAPFRTAIRDGGADAVMCSYNRINGSPSCENAATLSEIKDGFDGLVVPDFQLAVRDPLAATLAGADLPALSGDGGRTADMFTSGQVPATRLDDIVRRILFAVFDSGAYDHPVGAPADQASTPEHRQVAAQVAEAGMVLLKNRSGALPLSRRVRSLAVIGASGDDAMYVTGGSAGVPLAAGQAVTPLAGITARAGSAVKVTAAQGSAGDVPLSASVPAAVLTPPSGGGQGLRAEYWSNGDRSGAPALTRVEPTVDVTGPPSEAGPLWSARWTGTLTPPETGLYRFSLTLAGGATMTIDGHTFGPAYREATQFIEGPTYTLQGTVTLTARRPVPIEIDYSGAPGLFSQEAHLRWQPPSASGIPAAVAAARHADAAVVFANEAQGEGMDRTTLALPGDQDQLIEAVARANPHTIVVLNTGGPVLMPWLGDVDAVLEAWYPGQEFGDAISAVLFGDAEPSGRLPVTFPASDDQGPAPPSQPERYPGVDGDEHYDEGLLVGYRWYDQTGQRPLFPFGFGLSYADVRVSGVQARYDANAGVATVTAQVRNASARATSAVVELFLASPSAAKEPPRQLKGYDKVQLAPGERTTVTLHLTADELAAYDDTNNRWGVAPGRYTAFVGTSSTDLGQRATFRVGP